ncbi:efflux transporter, RND family, MFP subunit [Thermoanaerobacterium thermosaccharolyticum DSM 571]|uniref:Efflux transporter, RND family, MFP subunit n=1 Tax=Thermoanaerobacterium thermosaccharolyticum (strain ATCC 7956 / DSM 571 / NCIMB 9385 / NCA 3814 / NCTC 13789 / WDCM 00135 / 2032) TaxID=580327 RepID=D9TLU4_THETC|nr:efflux RND transporter periplasmic adaptor subunit [Thermoanaerobacterium thermosaccharolyticum]ADL70024.1 efflux transporter, RND family, MFP subunit [Thermoanaerobacterium thermosaccharolyticum DSM 571]
MKGYIKRFLAVVLMAGLAFDLSGCSIKTQSSSDKIPVKVMAASSGKLNSTIVVNGSLTPNKYADVSSKLAGQVIAVNADVGDKVKAGQLLVQIDTKELKAQLQQADASIAMANKQAEAAKVSIQAAQQNVEAAEIKVNSAKVSLDDAQKNYDRVKSLYDAGAASQSQLDAADTQLKQAQNQYNAALNQYESAKTQVNNAQKQYEIYTGPALQQAEAAKNVVQVQMTNSDIYAPLDGIVTNRNIQPGELATAGTPLLTIAETSTLKIEGTINEDIVPLLRVGQKVPVVIDAFPDKQFQGVISQIGPVATTTGQIFPIEIAVTNPGELKPGMTAKAMLSLTGYEGIVVPVSALRYESGKTYVFTIDNKGIARKRVVTLGLQNEKYVTILEGLSAGERVAVTNVNALYDKAAVTIIK